MPRIEFYVLPDTSPERRLSVACQLARKAWQAGLPVFMRCVDDATCAMLDDLLWRFRDASFVPHDLYDDNPHAPVVIGIDSPPATTQGLLINLHPQLSADLDQFSRVIEIVNQSPELLNLCRDNFREYRRRGYSPQRVEL